MNIADQLRQVTRYFPNKTALIFGSQKYSYRELDTITGKIAEGLLRAGIAPGDRVALYLPNTPDFVFSYLGCVKAGAVAVSLNSMLKHDEVLYIVNDSQASALITVRELLSNLPKTEEMPAMRQIISSGGGGTLSFDQIVGVSGKKEPEGLSPTEMGAILYTSGTTGRPKGATLSVANVVSNVWSTAHHAGMRPEDNLICFVPLFHCFGQNFVMNACFYSGGTLVLHRKYEEEEVLNSCLNNRASMFFAVPTVFILLLNNPEAGRYMETIRYFFSAAAMLPVDIEDKWHKAHGRVVFQGYGLTEASPFASYNHDFSYRPGSVGTPIENVEMGIADPDMRLLPPGQLGEIVIKGPNVMMGYYNQPDDTAQTIKDGWLRTGDIGNQDGDGYFYIVDRVKDMIITGGFNVYPREVEEALFQHPAVKEAAVVGVPDPVYGESVKAFVVPREGKSVKGEELIAFCKERIAAYKVPKLIEFVSVIPKSLSGKILKRQLRAKEERCR